MVGQKQEAVPDLGDPKKSDGAPNWDDRFLRDIHGAILITGDCDETVKENTSKDKVHQIFGETDEVDQAFQKLAISEEKPEGGRISGSSIKEIISIFGDGRKGDVSAHEQSVFVAMSM